MGRFISPSTFHRYPFVDNLDSLNPEALESLYKIAKEPREKKRVSKEKMESIILQLCEQQYVSISVLAKLVKRSQDLLRKNYLSKMLKE